MADTIQVGNVEIVAVLDMVPPPRDPTIFIRDYPREAWAPYEDEVLENGLLQLYYGSFFVRSQGKIILVDTGMGPGPHAHLENRTGDLIGQMQREGCRRGRGGHRDTHPSPPRPRGLERGQFGRGG